MNMPPKIEKLIGYVYGCWKKDAFVSYTLHPSEEEMACFLEGKVCAREKEAMIGHLLRCRECAERVSVSLKEAAVEESVPSGHLAQAKAMVLHELVGKVLEVVLSFKERVIELVSTTGDVLSGQELMPLSVLRSRRQQGFKDEIIIYKDFPDIWITVKVENKDGMVFDLIVTARGKADQKPIKELMISLLKDEIELESYCCEPDSAVFERVPAGVYNLSICSAGNKLAAVSLEVRV